METKVYCLILTNVKKMPTARFACNNTDKTKILQTMHISHVNKNQRIAKRRPFRTVETYIQYGPLLMKTSHFSKTYTVGARIIRTCRPFPCKRVMQN